MSPIGIEEVELEYGTEKIAVAINQKDLINLLKPSEVKTEMTEEEVISAALDHPIGSAPLAELFKPGDQVTIVANDVTRLVRSEVFLPILIDRLLSLGVKKDDITILFATGAHRRQTQKEWEQSVGRKLAADMRLEDHVCDNKQDLKYLGTTPSGTPVWVNRKVCPPYKSILTGEIGYHLFAGYSGGRKSLIPGVSAFETLQANHRLMLDPRSHAGSLDNNPLSEDMIAAASLVNPTFILNVILNSHKEIVRAFAGDFITAHQVGCKELDHLFGSVIKERTQLVIAGCGGYPKDINFYQAHKVLENISRLAEDNGVVIFFARCSEGIGSDSFRKGMEDYPTLSAIAERIYNNFEVGMHKALFLRKLIERLRVIIVSDLTEEEATVMGLIPAHSFEEAMEIANGLLGEAPSVSVVTDGSITWPLVEI